ncbi:polyglutamine-binding protein 1-like [Tropilaelaps mercedesae]|uniref:Polyglutamine-binding protein 1-like n=1 Tax=Tropilaelaps mercedesae TaxID=418985 RepID=A0A1V9XNN6_9ACAR|nr:polyglutamine-binding protein 1-like [Tropilaelaps mercedesae]
MPLPAALLARLTQRGLVKSTNDSDKHEHLTRDIPDVTAPAHILVTPQTDPVDEEEEVFAEDYDTAVSAAEIGPRLPRAFERARRAPYEPLGSPAPGCPNKWNAHHRCLVWCMKRWGNGNLLGNLIEGVSEEHPAMTRKRLRMLRKYPLPPKWMEEYDPGTGRFYYWHRDGKQVS